MVWEGLSPLKLLLQAVLIEALELFNALGDAVRLGLWLSLSGWLLILYWLILGRAAGVGEVVEVFGRICILEALEL